MIRFVVCGLDETFLTTSTARLAALIADQEWLLQVIRKKKTELVRMDGARDNDQDLAPLAVVRHPVLPVAVSLSQRIQGSPSGIARPIILP